MTANSRIVASALAAIRGETNLPTQPGLCLAMVRIIVERAFHWPSHEWYKWRTIAVKRSVRADTGPWARDMEASLRAARMDVPMPRAGPDGDPMRYVDLSEADPEPGDLLFRWDTARAVTGDWIGHVGIYLGHELVLENVDPRARPGCMNRGPTVLSRLGAWPVTTVIRFDPSVGPAA